MASRPPRSDMSVRDACTALGVAIDAPWTEIRRAYRQAMRRAHPDLATATSDATQRAARLNEAFAMLSDATDRGRRPLVASGDIGARAPVAPSAPPTLEVPAGDVFVRVLDAAYDIGDVSYIDPEAGLIQVLLGGGGPAASQLLIAIDASVQPATASFTLDSMDAEAAPDIREVVGRLGLALAAVG